MPSIGCALNSSPASEYEGSKSAILVVALFILSLVATAIKSTLRGKKEKKFLRKI